MPKTFGERLKKFRRKAAKSGEDISRYMTNHGSEISTATYYNWEKDSGAPDVRQLDALSAALGIKLNDLL